jgi:NTE family protein
VSKAERTAVVLSGGGARGAYEAGALSVLIPALERRGERPDLLVGTSVGAINAAYLAATANQSADVALEGLLTRWREVTKQRVINPILTRQVPLTALRYAGGILSLPGMRVPSLLDPSPLQDNLRRWLDWDAARSNIQEGQVSSLAAVCTSARTGRAVVFFEGGARQSNRPSHVIQYVQTELDTEHVRASAAIPILFPPVQVTKPPGARGWYVDGGARLNTPIKPALDLGAQNLVVVGMEAISEAQAPEPDATADENPPDFGDGWLHVLQGALTDPLIEDMRILGNVNAFFTDGNAPSAKRYRQARGKPPYRKVPYIFIAPGRRGAIGELASQVFKSRYGGFRALRSVDFPLLNRLIGGDSATHGELLSYLFFDQEFIEELIQMGQRDARRWLDAPPGPDEPWQTEPLDEFTRPSGDKKA